MKNEITFANMSGTMVPKLRGGRSTKVMKDKNRYCRKMKHKGVKEW